MFLLSCDTTIYGGAFTPDDLFGASEQGVWLDPSDLTTMWTTSAKTTQVAADGDPVGYMEDKSGNANHFDQATSTKRPTYKTSGGLHWLKFDGADDCLVSISNVDMSTTDEMMLVIGLSSEAATVKLPIELGTAYTSQGGFYLTQKASSGSEYTARGARSGQAADGAKIVTNMIENSDYVISGLTDLSANTNDIYLDGTFEATDTSSDLGTGNFSSTLDLNIGSRDNGASLQFGKKIYGVIMRGNTPTGTEQADTETWMGDQAGLTI